MNIVVGTVFRFTEAVFYGKYPRAKYSHDESHTVECIKESYGSLRGQHSFTLKVIESDSKQVGEVFRRLGRNLYPTAVLVGQPDNLSELEAEKRERSKAVKMAKWDRWLYEAEFEGKPWKRDNVPSWYIAMIS